ncbi:MAG TPA: hypothetical protein VF400_00855 [Anaeromyxobacteraceae bacterium]
MTLSAKLPAISRADRRRALLAGTVAVVVVGAVDVLASPGGTARLPLWAGWTMCFLAILPFQTGGPPWLAVVTGGVAGVWSMLTLLAMSWVSGGSHSIFFLILMMVPFMSALAAPGDTAEPVLEGVVGLVGGGALMRHEGRPWSEVLPWVTLVGIAAGFSWLAAIHARRRQEAFLRSQQERAEALEQLAAAELARTRAERWVALGQLADRVAHDVNSPLASICSNLKFVQAELGGAGGEVASAVQDGIDCADRIRTTIVELQTELRRGK